MTVLIGSRAAGLLAALLLSATACTNEPQPAGQDSTRDTTDAARGSPTGEASAPGRAAEPVDTTQPVGGQGSWTAGVVEAAAENDSVAVVRAVRVGRHSGFERITFEFDGTAMPGYHIEYVDRPVHACGSGDVVPLRGDAYLSIRFYPAAAHTEQGQPTIPQREMTIDQPIIKELKRTCDFEAVVVFVTGQSTPAPFSARVLRSPLRLVVDLRG